VYVFADMNCIYCHLAFKAITAYGSDINVNWLPVAVLGSDSLPKAAHVLDSPVPFEAFKLGQENWKRPLAIDASAKVDEKVIEAIKSNTRLMGKLGLRGTPGFVYRDEKGQIRSVEGMPSLSLLAQILNRDKIPNTDPDLARFDQ